MANLASDAIRKPIEPNSGKMDLSILRGLLVLFCLFVFPHHLRYSVHHTCHTQAGTSQLLVRELGFERKLWQPSAQAEGPCDIRPVLAWEDLT